MEARWCTACGRQFQPRPQSQNQAYCTEDECQRARKRLWQRAKRKSDPDYLANQAQAQRAWCRRNPEYWQNYRETHPDYVARNRENQRRRAKNQEPPTIAKMDAPTNPPTLHSGLYRLTSMDASSFAKMDAWIVRLTVLQALGGES